MYMYIHVYTDKHVHILICTLHDTSIYMCKRQDMHTDTHVHILIWTCTCTYNVLSQHDTSTCTICARDKACILIHMYTY